MTKRFIGTFAALGMLLSGAAAFAATETNNLTVSAVVTDTCEVTVGNIDFGTLENWKTGTGLQRLRMWRSTARARPTMLA